MGLCLACLPPDPQGPAWCLTHKRLNISSLKFHWTRFPQICFTEGKKEGRREGRKERWKEGRRDERKEGEMKGRKERWKEGEKKGRKVCMNELWGLFKPSLFSSELDCWPRVLPPTLLSTSLNYVDTGNFWLSPDTRSPSLACLPLVPRSITSLVRQWFQIAVPGTPTPMSFYHLW